MLDALQRFILRHDDNHDAVRLLPFKAGKLEIVKESYKFYNIYSEYIRMIDAGYFVNEFNPAIIRFMKNQAENIRATITTMVRTKDRDELVLAYDRIYDTAALPLSGYAAFDNTPVQRIYCSPSYSTKMASKSEFRELIKRGIESLALSRKDLNAVTVMGAPADGYGAFHDSCMETMLDVKAMFKENKLNNYVLADDNESYKYMVEYFNDGRAFEKCIYSGSGSIVISTNFDIGFMASRYMTRFMMAADADMTEDVKHRFTNLRTKVAKGGLIFLLMPRVFFNADILEMLLTHMKNINVFFGGNMAQLALVVGNKTDAKAKNIDNLVEAMGLFASGEEKESRLELLNQPMARVRFRSDYPMAVDVEKVIADNAHYICRFDSQISKKLELKTEEEVRHPLLPFSPGQLGLVLVSGKIDGIVDEGDGAYHVIKGSTRPRTTTTEKYDENYQPVTEITRSAATSVAMLTADGNYIELV